MRLIPGGLPETGNVVTVAGRPATVVKAGFSTHVFSNDAIVRYEDGTLDLISLDLLDQENGPVVTSRPNTVTN